MENMMKLLWIVALFFTTAVSAQMPADMGVVFGYFDEVRREGSTVCLETASSRYVIEPDRYQLLTDGQAYTGLEAGDLLHRPQADVQYLHDLCWPPPPPPVGPQWRVYISTGGTGLVSYYKFDVDGVTKIKVGFVAAGTLCSQSPDSYHEKRYTLTAWRNITIDGIKTHVAHCIKE